MWYGAPFHQKGFVLGQEVLDGTKMAKALGCPVINGTEHNRRQEVEADPLLYAASLGTGPGGCRVLSHARLSIGCQMLHLWHVAL